MISFVPLRLSHIPLIHGWLGRPHLMTWWTRGKTYSLEQIAAMYGSRARGEDATKGFVIERGGQPAGYAQYYPIAPDALPDGVSSLKNRLFTAHPPAEIAGVDLFVADELGPGKGQGADVLQAFLTTQVFPKFRVAAVDPLKANTRAIRAFQKAGFRATDFSEAPESVVMLSLRTP